MPKRGLYAEEKLSCAQEQKTGRAENAADQGRADIDADEKPSCRKKRVKQPKRTRSQGAIDEYAGEFFKRFDKYPD